MDGHPFLQFNYDTVGIYTLKIAKCCGINGGKFKSAMKGLAIFPELPPPNVIKLHMICGLSFSERGGVEQLCSGWRIIFKHILNVI